MTLPIVHGPRVCIKCGVTPAAARADDLVWIQRRELWREVPTRASMSDRTTDHDYDTYCFCTACAEIGFKKAGNPSLWFPWMLPPVNTLVLVEVETSPGLPSAFRGIVHSYDRQERAVRVMVNIKTAPQPFHPTRLIPDSPEAWDTLNEQVSARRAATYMERHLRGI